MIYTLKNDRMEVFIKKVNNKYLVNIKSKASIIKKEFSTRLELICALENSFSENVFYKIP